MEGKSRESVRVRVKVASVLLAKADPPLTSREFDYRVPAGTDAAGLVDALGLPKNLVGSVTVNNRRSPGDRVLDDGDRVAIIPTISGG